jgi:hypothetical protein
VIVGLVCVKLGQWQTGWAFLRHADALAALLVAVIALWITATLGLRTIRALLDAAPAGLAPRIVAAVAALPGVVDCHKVRIRPSGPRVFVEQVDCVSGVGYDRADAAGATAVRFHHIHHVVSNKGVFDFETPDHAMRIRSLHPGVTVDEVQELTSFELVVPDDVPESRLPTDEELRLIRDVLDPANARAAEVPDE